MTGSADPVGAELERFARIGLDLHGFLSAEGFDRHAGPGYAGGQRPDWLQTAILIGGRGDRFCAHALASGADRSDPLDELVEETLQVAVLSLRAAGLRSEAIPGHRPRGDAAGGFCDLVALGAAAGLGWPSRLGLLIHPEAGPWTHFRGVLLVDTPLPAAEPLPGAGPCAGCPAPCIGACPGGAIGVGFDAVRCGETRVRTPGCAAGCDARRACIVGTEFGYSAHALAWHMEHAVAHRPRPGPISTVDPPGG